MGVPILHKKGPICYPFFLQTYLYGERHYFDTAEHGDHTVRLYFSWTPALMQSC